MNLIILSGRMGKDPERKTFQNGSVVNFSLAETVTVNGEKKAVWHEVEAWGKVSDTIERYCQKGAAVTVQGALKYDEYENKDGQKVKRAKINVFGIEIHSGWREHSTGDNQLAQPTQQAQSSQSQGAPWSEEKEDDLPF